MIRFIEGFATGMILTTVAILTVLSVSKKIKLKAELSTVDEPTFAGS